jgi:hypothetical protein
MDWWENKYIAPETQCWIWKGSVVQGYGVIYEGYQTFKVHRLSYKKFKGDIPEGYIVHHVCENKRCFNPAHLEAVKKGDHGKKHLKEVCKHGHPMTEENREARSGRCKTCSMKKFEEFTKKRRERKVAAWLERSKATGSPSTSTISDQQPSPPKDFTSGQQ